MATTDTSDGDADAEYRARADGADSGTASAVCACRTSPEKTVFTESGHTDAWIATDLTVSVDR